MRWLTKGLESLTLRRVAEALVPGLVDHYFPAVDDLVAVAFGTAAAAELDEIVAAVDAGSGPLQRMRLLVAELVADYHDRISLLWIDAWHATHSRPVLRDEVTRQMLARRDRIAELVRSGVTDGRVHLRGPVGSRRAGPRRDGRAERPVRDALGGRPCRRPRPAGPNGRT